MLNAAELDRMRTVTERSMPGTAIISSGTLLNDHGDINHVYAPSGTVPYRIAPATAKGDEGTVGGVISADAEWIVTLPEATAIDTEDQIEFDLPELGTMTVVAVRGPRTFETTRRVEVRSLS